MSTSEAERATPGWVGSYVLSARAEVLQDERENLGSPDAAHVASILGHPLFCRWATSPYNLEGGLETNNMANREQRGNKEKKKPKQEKDKKDKTPAPPFVQPQLLRKPHKGKQQG